MTGLDARTAALRARVVAAAERAGRDPATVRIVAVSKRHPPEAVATASRAGLTRFGENYVQEMIAKQDALAGDPACAACEWHFIGGLQRNKVKQLIGRVALIHAIDSVDLAAEVDRRARERGVRQAVLVAVSAAGEAQKTGASAEEAAALLAAMDAMPGLECRGLMTMPPLPETAEASRPYFAALRALRDRLARAGRPLAELSMGTTADLEVAVEEGATLVRVGTALFGPRPPRA